MMLPPRNKIVNGDYILEQQRSENLLYQLELAQWLNYRKFWWVTLLPFSSCIYTFEDRRALTEPPGHGKEADDVKTQAGEPYIWMIDTLEHYSNNNFVGSRDDYVAR